MIQGSEDSFIKTAGGLYVAWSLTVPSQWGDWVLVELLCAHKRAPQPSHCISQVVPIRAMAAQKVQELRCRPLLFWGMKVPNAPWALVLCRQVNTLQASSSFEGEYTDPTRAIGV